MRKPRVLRTTGEAPPERRPARPPRLDAKRPAPKGDPPAPRTVSVPKARRVGAPPNPHKPAIVRHVIGGALKDLFVMFPDLPRPSRPARRTRSSR